MGLHAFVSVLIENIQKINIVKYYWWLDEYNVDRDLFHKPYMNESLEFIKYKKTIIFKNLLKNSKFRTLDFVYIIILLLQEEFNS